MKKCSKCGIVKSFDSFGKASNLKSGFRSVCKECRHLDYIKNREAVIAKSMKYHYNNKDKIAKYRKQYRADNLASSTNNQKEYYQRNREQICSKRREYVLSNPEAVSQINKNWRDENKVYCNIKRAEKRANNVGYRMGGNIASKIRIALKGGAKSAKTIKLTGCSIDGLKKHIEKQFIKGMSWDNYGLYGWHIDHIKPCSSFDLTKKENQMKCFNYVNLQPLWALDNLKKGSKILKGGETI